MSLKDDIKKLESNPKAMRKIKLAKIIISIDYLLWIGSILVLIYQFNTTSKLEKL